MNTYSRFNKIAYAIALVLMVVCFAMVDSASASHRSSYGAFAPDGSMTIETQSNTNLVMVGYKGAYGVYGILLPKEGKTITEHVKKDKNIDTVSLVIEEDNTVNNEVVPEVVENDPVDDTESDSNKGNPGNDKPVGNAGEKCHKGMCENTDGVTGEHGKSNKD